MDKQESPSIVLDQQSVQNNEQTNANEVDYSDENLQNWAELGHPFQDLNKERTQIWIENSFTPETAKGWLKFSNFNYESSYYIAWLRDENKIKFNDYEELNFDQQNDLLNKFQQYKKENGFEYCGLCNKLVEKNLMLISNEKISLCSENCQIKWNEKEAEITEWEKINWRFRYSSDCIKEWKEANFTLADAQQWSNLGFGVDNAQKTANWRDRFSFEEANYWIEELGLNKDSFQQAYYWKSNQIKPSNKAELKQLQETGFNAQQWLDFFYPQDGVYLINDNKYNYGIFKETENSKGKKRSEIKELNFSSNYLIGALDLTTFPNLESLDCSYNKITNLILPISEKLKTVFCGDNKLSSIELNNCLKLEKLDISNNQLVSLNLNNNSELVELRCQQNKLKELNLSNNLLLKTIYLYYNQLTELDLTGLVELEKIETSDNLLTSFNYETLNPNTLTQLNISDNNLPVTDIVVFNNFINLELLWVGGEDKDKFEENIYNRFYGSLASWKNLVKLKSIYISNTDINAGLEYLSESVETINYSTKERPDCKLKEIEEDLDNFEYSFVRNKLNNMYPDKDIKIIDNLYIEGLRGRLDLSEYQNLEELICYNNDLIIIDISKCLQLKKLICNDNKLKNIDIENNIYLEKLNCSNNQLTNLNLTKNNNLISINCLNNEKIKDLDFSQNLKLEELFVINEILTPNSVDYLERFFVKKDKESDRYVRRYDNVQEWLDDKYDKENIGEIDLSDLDNVSIEKEKEWKLNISEFSNLKKIMSSSKVSLINKLTITNCLKLEEIEVSYFNGNEELEVRNCSKLEKINCSNSKIKKLILIELPLLKVLNIKDNNFHNEDFSFLTNLTNLEELYLGNTDEERIKDGEYNDFIGSLEKLESLTKLKILDISNTDINSGWKQLPKSLIKVDFSKEIEKKDGEKFKVVFFRRLIENRFSVKKVPNLPTFYHSKREEPEYYDPNPVKWGLKEKIKEDFEKIYSEISPRGDSREECEYGKCNGLYEHYRTKVEDLPTKLLKIEERKLKLINVKIKEEDKYKVVDEYKDKDFAYAILSYNWGREKEEQKEFERENRSLQRDKKSLIEKSNFFFTEEQYKNYKLKDINDKEITENEIEEKSPAFSKTLLKAVETCRLLGIEYLWMDQLCVNQHNAGEKNHEVNQMSKYYGNSAVTLVAIHKNISERKIDKLDPVLAIEKIINSEWFSRSWCFQEGWLSKRTLFMFDDMLVNGGYLAQVWAYNQATDVEGKYSGRREFENKEVKIATPIGWASYQDEKGNGYKSEEKLTFRLHEVLRGIKDRKRAFPIDGIYSILGLLPYQVEPRYKDNYEEDYPQKELKRVMKEAAKHGYLEHLSWHGLGNDWIPEINNISGSFDVWGGIDINCVNWRINDKNDEEEVLSLILKKSYKLPIENEIEDIRKIGGDSIEGGVFSGMIKFKISDKLESMKIWGTEKSLELVKEGNFLIIPDKSELQSDTPFGILVRKEEKNLSKETKKSESLSSKEKEENNDVKSNNSSNKKTPEDKTFYCSKIGLVEIEKEDIEKLEKENEKNSKNEGIRIKFIENKNDINFQQANNSKRVFLGGTCNNSNWREKLIPLLKINYFNPVVKDWTSACQEREIREREACDFVLYVITREMTGFYAIAEVVEDSVKKPKKTIFCYLEEGFTDHQIKALKSTARMVKSNGAQCFTSLERIADFLNRQQIKTEEARVDDNNDSNSLIESIEINTEITICPRNYNKDKPAQSTEDNQELETMIEQLDVTQI